MDRSHASRAQRAIIGAPWLLPFGIALLLIVLNAGLAIMALDYFHNSNARANHALQVMLAVDRVEDLAEASDVQQRRYRLFGDPAHLEGYRKAQAELPAALEQLGDMLRDESEQAERFAMLSRMIDQHSKSQTADLGPVVARFDEGRVPQDFAASFARGDAIVQALDGMLKAENELARNQLAKAGKEGTRALIAGTALGSVVVLLIAALCVFARRHARRTEDLARTQFAALQESEQRFARVFEESPVGIVLTEPGSQRIVQTNPAFCRLLCADATQIVGSTMMELAHVNDRELLRGAVDGGIGPDRGIEVRYITRTGAVAWASVRLTRLSEPPGRPGLLLAMVEDITREKRVEAELRQAQKMEAVGQLTGGMAHDFNNLLGVIIGNVEFLIDKLQDKLEHAGLAQEILTSALSGADLTRRLLAFARRQTLQPRQIDLNAYLPNHITIVRRLLGETIKVTANLAPHLWSIRADPSQVGDALLNLAINARDAMPHGGRIAIETANTHLEADQQDVEVRPGQYVMLAVTDTGRGMQAEVLERAMEPFFTTKGPGEGSGLGLSMIFGFVKQSGGHMRIDSEPASGTTVRLFFPRAQVVDAENASGAGPPMPSGTETILLVDDNAGMRGVARRHLASLGYHVNEAASGPAALMMLQEGGKCDLLFTDVVMPEGMTGYELAVEAHRLRPSLKVLFTSGFARHDSAAEFPPWPMIRKPYRKHDLAAMVRAALEA